MLHQEKVEVRKTQLVFIMMRRKPSYCSGRGRIYSTKACPGVSVQQPVGIYLEEQTQPFHWVGRLRKMTISSEDYCSNIALSPKSNFLRPYCLNPCLNRFCLSYLFLLPPSTFVCHICHICFCCHLQPLFVYRLTESGRLANSLSGRCRRSALIVFYLSFLVICNCLSSFETTCHSGNCPH